MGLTGSRRNHLLRGILSSNIRLPRRLAVSVMRQFRFILATLLAALLVINTTFWQRAAAILLCGVLGINLVAWDGLLNQSETVNAALPPTRQIEAINTWTGKRTAAPSNFLPATILAEKPKPTVVPKLTEEQESFERTFRDFNKGKSDASEYDFQLIAKYGDIIDGKEVGRFDNAGLNVRNNLIDDNGHVVYRTIRNFNGDDRQIFRDRKVVAYVGQKIDSFVVVGIQQDLNYTLCKNGNLDIWLTATDLTGARKRILTRNGKIIHIQDYYKYTPLPQYYLSDACNITNSHPSQHELDIDRLFKATGLKIPYAKLLGLPSDTHFTDLLSTVDINAKGEVLLSIQIVYEDQSTEILILGKPKKNNRESKKRRGNPSQYSCDDFKEGFAPLWSGIQKAVAEYANEEYPIPESLLAAISAQETGGPGASVPRNIQENNPHGFGIGPFQIDFSNAKQKKYYPKITPSQVFSPTASTDFPKLVQAFSDKKITPKQAVDPTLAAEYAAMLIEEGLQRYHGDLSASLSYYNNGKKGGNDPSKTAVQDWGDDNKTDLQHYSDSVKRHQILIEDAEQRCGVPQL